MKAKKLEFRVRFVIDEEARFEECNGEARPLTESEYADNQYMDDARKPIPYDEYLRYYGNPDRHLYFQCDVEKKCPHCGTWSYETGLGGIDMMDDSPEASETPYMTPERAWNMGGYFQEVARDSLIDAGYKMTRAQAAERRAAYRANVKAAKLWQQQHGGAS